MQGTSKAYLLSRLARDHPTVLKAYERSEYRSVRAAAKAAGIVKETTRFAHLCHHWTKASPEDRAQFLQWLQTQQDT